MSYQSKYTGQEIDELLDSIGQNVTYTKINTDRIQGSGTTHTLSESIKNFDFILVEADLLVTTSGNANRASSIIILSETIPVGDIHTHTYRLACDTADNSTTNWRSDIIFGFTSETAIGIGVNTTGSAVSSNRIFGISNVYGVKIGSSKGDSAPTGNIISFMGTIAPTGYLVCDGAELNIADYPKLASHFELQFGSKNHFGGNGSTTFAVPDLRNEFLRGYHGDKEEQLSDEIGIHQDATKHNNIYVSNYGKSLYSPNYYYADASDPTHNTNSAKNQDSTTKLSDLGTDASKYNIAAVNNMSVRTNSSYSASYANYTSRPTNVAVLYCIKY